MTTWIRDVGSTVNPAACSAPGGARHQDTTTPAAGARQTRMVRYEVKVRARGDDELASLRRAIARWRGTARLIVAVEARRDGDALTMTFALRRRGARAVREAERVFAFLWYDAFGVWDVEHAGRLIE